MTKLEESVITEVEEKTNMTIIEKGIVALFPISLVVGIIVFVFRKAEGSAVGTALSR